MVNKNGNLQNDFNNPLFVHPGDGANALDIDEKLIGISNYRSWRRNVEIGLVAKRKLGFVTGTIARPTDDDVRADQWDTANHMVISWILHSVSESIKKSILFIDSAKEIWKQLEKRFALTNGAHKYKLNKDITDMKQGKLSISEFYTKMKCVWEELDSMNDLPKLSVNSREVSAFLSALEKQKEEMRLFQFLFGLNKEYSDQRSQILIMNPLPTVEMACAILQQEESQRIVVNGYSSVDYESAAMYSKRGELKCNVCGYKGHNKDNCWTVIGYPDWHPKAKQFPMRNSGVGDRRNGKEIWKTQDKKWNNGDRRTGGFKGPSRTVAHVSSKGSEEGSGSAHITGNNITLTAQQFEQLLRQIPSNYKSGASTSETDDEIDAKFAGPGHP